MEVDEEGTSKKRKVEAATSAAVVVKAAKATKESLPSHPPAGAEAEAETSTDTFQPTVDNATHGKLVETDHFSVDTDNSSSNNNNNNNNNNNTDVDGESHGERAKRAAIEAKIEAKRASHN